MDPWDKILDDLAKSKPIKAKRVCQCSDCINKPVDPEPEINSSFDSSNTMGPIYKNKGFKNTRSRPYKELKPWISGTLYTNGLRVYGGYGPLRMRITPRGGINFGIKLF